MKDISKLVFYQENKIDIEKKIAYYKNLSVNAVIINPFTSIDDKIINEISRLARVYDDEGLVLFLAIDIIKISKILLQKDDIDWKIPKIRTGFYKFISFLSKHGIKGIYFENLENLGDSYKDFDFYIRELSKNTIRNNHILGIASIGSDDKKLIKILKDASFKNYSAIDFPKKEFTNLIDYKSSLLDSSYEEMSLELSERTYDLLNLTNYKNFPYYSQSLLAGVSFFKNSLPILKDNEEFGTFIPHQNSNDYKVLKESKENFEFYKNLLEIRKDKKAIIDGSLRQILNKDTDILAFVRTYDKKKVLVFANFSQKEVLCDIRFHFIDLYDFKYLIGNYGRRRIVKNLLLRPYEFIAFAK